MNFNGKFLQYVNAKTYSQFIFYIIYFKQIQTIMYHISVAWKYFEYHHWLKRAEQFTNSQFMSSEFKVIVLKQHAGTKTSTKLRQAPVRKLKQCSLLILSFGAAFSLYICVCAICVRNNKTREFYLNRQFAILLQM